MARSPDSFLAIPSPAIRTKSKIDVYETEIRSGEVYVIPKKGKKPKPPDS